MGSVPGCRQAHPHTHMQTVSLTQSTHHQLGFVVLKSVRRKGRRTYGKLAQLGSWQTTALGPTYPTSCLCKSSFMGTQPRHLQRRPTVWATKPNTCAAWPCTEVYRPWSGTSRLAMAQGQVFAASAHSRGRGSCGLLCVSGVCVTLTSSSTTSGVKAGIWGQL